MNLFQSTENKKFDSSVFVINKCDLLVISVHYRDSDDCYWSLIHNPKLSTIEEFELMEGYCSSSIMDVPLSIIKFLKQKDRLQVYSPNFVINSILNASNPKLVQVTL